MAQGNRIVVILGSIREGRMNDRVAAWVTKELEAHGFLPELLDPVDPEILPVQTGSKNAIEQLRQRMANADGFVIVTPEFNHSAPGPLKTLIDSVKEEWQVRPVGLISYGGISGGLRAIEALRLVLAELHAVTLRDTVSFVAPWNTFDAAGRLKSPEDASKAEAAMSVFTQRLHWWSDALNTARATRPFELKVA